MSPSVIDGSLIVGIGSAFVTMGVIIYKLWTRQQHHHRALYGDSDDDTRNGLAVDQERGFAEIHDRLDEIEASLDEGFAEAEQKRQETRRDVEDLRQDVTDLCQSVRQVTRALGREGYFHETDLLPTHDDAQDEQRDA